MFGLTRREQQWKAEQQTAELLVELIATIVKSAAKIREAEAIAQAQADALEVERLRLKVAELEQKLNVSNAQLIWTGGTYQKDPL